MENVPQNTKPNNFDLVTLDKNLPDTSMHGLSFIFHLKSLRVKKPKSTKTRYDLVFIFHV